MKKMLLATALALLITGCSTDVYCSKQTGSSSTKGNHHPSFLRFGIWAEEKLSMQPKLRERKQEEMKPSTKHRADCSVLLL